jgi:hypothetical protein
MKKWLLKLIPVQRQLVKRQIVVEIFAEMILSF